MVRLRSNAGVRPCKARQKARKGIVLREAGITKATQSRYYCAVSLLCKIVQAADDMEDLDEQVSAWIEGQFQKGSPINTTEDALSGLHFFVPGMASFRDLAKDRNPRGPALGYGLLCSAAANV